MASEEGITLRNQASAANANRNVRQNEVNSIKNDLACKKHYLAQIEHECLTQKNNILNVEEQLRQAELNLETASREAQDASAAVEKYDAEAAALKVVEKALRVYHAAFCTRRGLVRHSFIHQKTLV